MEVAAAEGEQQEGAVNLNIEHAGFPTHFSVLAFSDLQPYPSPGETEINQDSDNRNKESAEGLHSDLQLDDTAVDTSAYSTTVLDDLDETNYKYRDSSLERKYACTICFKRFTRPQHVPRHMKSCTRNQRHYRDTAYERKHACTICQKRFTQAHHVPRHMKTCGGTNKTSAVSSTSDSDEANLPLPVSSPAEIKPQEGDSVSNSPVSGEGLHSNLLLDNIKTETDANVTTEEVDTSADSTIVLDDPDDTNPSDEDPESISASNYKYRDASLERKYACTICFKRFTRPQHVLRHMKSCRITQKIKRNKARAKLSVSPPILPSSADSTIELDETHLSDTTAEDSESILTSQLKSQCTDEDTYGDELQMEISSSSSLPNSNSNDFKYSYRDAISERKHACTICHKLFTRPHHVPRHMKTCRGDNKATGNVSTAAESSDGESSDSESSDEEKVLMDIHLPPPISDTSPYIEKFFSALNLQENHDSDSTKCEICLWRFSTADGLSEHKLSSTRRSCVKATPVNKPDAVELIGMQIEHYEDYIYGQLSEPPQLRNQISDYSPVAKQCTICEKVIGSKHFGRHMLIHSGIKLHVCDLCPKRFSRADSLASHKKNFHKGGTVKVHIPSIVKPKPVNTTSTVKQKSVNPEIVVKETNCKTTGERVFVCEICGENSFTKSDRLSHAKSHFDTPLEEVDPDQYIRVDKTFIPQTVSCGLCDKTFHRKRDVRNHILRHIRDIQRLETTPNPSTNKAHQQSPAQEQLSPTTQHKQPPTTPKQQPPPPHQQSTAQQQLSPTTPHKQRPTTPKQQPPPPHQQSPAQQQLSPTTQHKQPPTTPEHQPPSPPKPVTPHRTTSLERTTKHRCSNCSKCFLTNNHLKRHMKSCSNNKHKYNIAVVERKYPCPICNKRFTRPHHVPRHMKNCRMTSTTSENVSDISQMDTEDSIHNATTPTILNDTAQNNTTQEVTPNNTKTTTHNTVIIPPEQFSDIEQIVSVKGFDCSICGKVLARKDTLLRHEATHLKNSTFGDLWSTQDTQDTIETAPDTISPEQLSDIQQTVPVKGFPCSVCGKILSRRDHLTRHEANHMKNKLPISNTVKFESPDSSSTFGDLWSQMDTQDTIKTASDPISPQQFSDIEEIVPAKGFACSICGKVLSRRDHLIRHEATHLKNKVKSSNPVKIESVDSSGDQESSTMIVEAEIHHPPAEFATSNHFMLQTSDDTHKDTDSIISPQIGSPIKVESSDSIPKRHECSECGKDFSRNHDLVRHLVKKHPAKQHSPIHKRPAAKVINRPHNCTICGKGFTRADHVTRHMLIHTKQRT